MATTGQRAAVHIVRAAKKHKGFSIRRPHLDGMWIVNVNEKGKLSFDGPAAQNYLETTTIAQLSREDILGLLSETTRLNAGGAKHLAQQHLLKRTTTTIHKGHSNA
jgi:hypothetical protein